MNKLAKVFALAALCAAFLLIGVSANAQTAPAKPADEFFVVSSVDRTHNAMILLRPTEIASSFLTTDKTQYFDENGKPLKLSDFRAGDTIFATYQTGSGGAFSLERVRKGDMTVTDLRRRYLPDLPVDAGQTSQSTTSTKTKSKAPTATPKTNPSKSGGTTSTPPKPNSKTPAKPKSGQTSHQ
jgi:hypothetical protein